MAILGRYWDKQVASRVGDNLSGVTTGTLAHSLPATNPELFLPIFNSIAAVGGNNVPGTPQLLAVGGNASILTIGFIGGSAPSFPTIAFTVHAAVIHTYIR